MLLGSLCSQAADSQSFADGDHWYSNPLGFSPLELHAKNGFLVPAMAVTACLLFTKKDPSPAGQISFYNENGVSWGYKIPNTTLFENNSGFAYGLRRWMKAGVELSFYFVRDEYNNTQGIGIRPFTRFFPFNRAIIKGGGTTVNISNTRYVSVSYFRKSIHV